MSNDSNYFVALKLADSKAIVDAINAIQAEMTKMPGAPPWISEAFIKPHKAHITFFPLYVNEDDLELIKVKFERTKSEVFTCIREHFKKTSSYSLPLQLEFDPKHSLDSFRNANNETFAVFLKPVENPVFELLLKIQNVIARALGTPTYDFRPHVSVARTKHVSATSVPTGSAISLEGHFESSGHLLDKLSCDIVTIDLLKNGEFDASFYYKSYASYSLNEREILVAAQPFQQQQLANDWMFVIDQEEAGVHRMVAYTNDKERVRYPMTMLSKTPLQYDSIWHRSTYYGRLGVLEVVYPECLAYRDGIS